MNWKRVLNLAITLAVLTALALSGVVWADDVANNLDDSVDATLETATIYVGDSISVGFKIVADSGGGDVAGCNVDTNYPAYFKITPPDKVLLNGNTNSVTLTFTSCGTFQYVTFSSNTAGSYQIGNNDLSISGGKPGSKWDLNPARFDLIVNARPTPSPTPTPTPIPDTTPPVITYTIGGTLGNNGWYVSDVTVTWTVTDSESAITSTSGCDSTTITTDTSGTTLTCTATSAGGTASQSVTIKRDATPPSVTISAERVPDSNGWYNKPIGFTVSGSDATSGVASCDTLSDYSGPDGDALSVSATCTDNAGNVGSGSFEFKYDATPPTITWINGPADGASYYFGDVPAAPTCTASDGLSGVDGACTISGYSTAVGSHTLTATATDKAGNTQTETRTYKVLAWTLKGFYQPVDMNNVLNVVKGGSTVPLKFEIFAGATELTDTAAVYALKYGETACNANAVTDEIETVATGGTSLRYDWTAGQFIFNWKTPTTPGKCYRVTMTTQDGSSLQAFFKIK